MKRSGRGLKNDGYANEAEIVSELALKTRYETFLNNPYIMRLPVTQYGYARVSTRDQTLQSQIDALTAAGCDALYKDTASGANLSRPGMEDLLARVRPEDTIVVVSLDRFGRTLTDLIAKIEGFDEQGIGFRSLRENIDTTTPAGKFMLQVFAALAEFERARIRERTFAGLAAAAANGRKGGRPRKANPKVCQKARAMLAQGLTKEQIARALEISRATLYRLLAEETP